MPKHRTTIAAMSEAGSEGHVEIEEDVDDSLTFSESDILIWKVLDILSDTRTESPYFTFQGIKFRMILELNFCKNIRDDFLEMTIEKCGTYSGEFRDFEIGTCIKSAYGDKYIANATISSSILERQQSVWSAKRKSLLIDYNNLTGQDSAQIVKFCCAFEQKSEFCQKKIYESNDKTEQLSNKPEKSPSIQRLYAETDNFDYLTILSSDFKKIFKNNIEADMVLKCGFQSFSVQKAILLARCEKFVQECSKKNINGTTQIINIEPSVLGRFLEYVYSGTLADLTEDIARKLYDVGSKYEVKHLPSLCSEFMKEKLRDTNALPFLLLSDKHKDEGFKKEIIGFLLKDDYILRSGAWKRFSGTNPKLACEVFQLAHKIFSSN